jgi:Kef-type K+ transport system membrane component KefB
VLHSAAVGSEAQAIRLFGAAALGWLLFWVLLRWIPGHDASPRQVEIAAIFGVVISAIVGTDLPPAWLWLMFAFMLGFLTSVTWWGRADIARLLADRDW